ncbi:hypothetical protein N183_35000 [Sinorhizobium sp. Sb3]|nr:hypothetical protein N183_35000 [Sinorhizobium sp. Sb3]
MLPPHKEPPPAKVVTAVSAGHSKINRFGAPVLIAGAAGKGDEKRNFRCR